MRLFAYMVIALWVLTGLVGSELGLPANEIDLQQILKSPNLSEWAGHDELGRSIGARLALGARTSLFVALLVVTITTVVGTIIGIVAAYFGGWIDLIVSRLMDLFLAFPGILLAIALAAMLGPGLNNLVIALSVVGWVGFARLARAQVLSVKTREHVMAAKALG
ncbi:MAG TPA: ABC transporter permease, partial [Gammaproteobacteria bacterium]|nr:ABC transporter permease [Gammaproteobacteria bacterium]